MAFVETRTRDLNNESIMRFLFDITQTLSHATPVIEGDEPFSATWSLSLAKGGAANVTALRMSPHLGTHLDAALHTEPFGSDVLSIDPALCVGEALVLELSTSMEQGALALIEPRELEGALALAGYAEAKPLPARVLLKTRRQPLSSTAEPYRAVSAAAVAYLRHRGVQVLGTDTFGVDSLESTDLAAHHEALGHGMVLLENLYLKEVKGGRYTLVALPLKIAGLEASPVRAILCELI